MNYIFEEENLRKIFDYDTPMLCFREMTKDLSEEEILEILETEIDIDLSVDTGDGGAEFTANTLSPSWVGRNYGYGYRLVEWTSIVWLTKQQGYKKTELNRLMHTIEKMDSADREKLKAEKPYLFSTAYEIWHELSEFNVLTFFVKMKMKDAILLYELKNWGLRTKNWNGYVMIDRATRTGFHDYSQGSGSLLGITLEKDVKLPVKHIHLVYPDEAHGYCSAGKVWLDDSLWDKGGVKLIHMPKKFRRELKALGYDEAVLNVHESNLVLKKE